MSELRQPARCYAGFVEWQAIAKRRMEIYDKRQNGMTLQAIASEYGVSKQRVRAIVARVDRDLRA